MEKENGGGAGGRGGGGGAQSVIDLGRGRMVPAGYQKRSLLERDERKCLNVWGGRERVWSWRGGGQIHQQKHAFPGQDPPPIGQHYTCGKG